MKKSRMCPVPVSMDQAETIAEELMLSGGSALMIFPQVHGTLKDQPLRIALGLASGRAMNRRKCRSGSILLADGYLTADFIANELKALNVKNSFPKKLHIISSREMSYSLKDVARHVIRGKNVLYDLAIIDPLWAFLPPECEGNDAVMKDMLKNVQEIQRMTGTAVLCVCHRGNRIRPDDYPEAMLRKSGVIGSCFDQVIEVKKSD